MPSYVTKYWFKRPARRVASLILLNTAVEFRRLADYLHGFKLPVRIGFEAAGNYHRPLAHFLHQQGFHLELIASPAVARTREAMHNSWDKNDPKDAQVLLHLLAQGITRHFHDPLVHGIHDVRELSLTYTQVSFEKTRTQHRLLTHYLPLHFPEIERHYHASRSRWLLELLQAFPTPGSITALSREEFVLRAVCRLATSVRSSPGYFLRRLRDEWFPSGSIANGLPPELYRQRKDALWPQHLTT